MSDQMAGSFYGVKLAAIDDLVAMVGAGNDPARDELMSRLQPQLLELAKLYLVAYGADRAIEALTDDLTSVRASL